jgi:hypothetical protein
MQSPPRNRLNLPVKTKAGRFPFLLETITGGMSRRYEITRSATHSNLQLIYPAGRFEALPFEVRLLAPWVGGESIDIETLRPEHRTEIAWQGFTVVRGAPGLANAA